MIDSILNWLDLAWIRIATKVQSSFTAKQRKALGAGLLIMLLLMVGSMLSMCGRPAAAAEPASPEHAVVLVSADGKVLGIARQGQLPRCDAGYYHAGTDEPVDADDLQHASVVRCGPMDSAD